LPTLIVTPAAGFNGKRRFATAQPNTVLSPAKSLSFTVFGLGTRPVRGEGVVSR
jgi:hypothetical protein